MRKLQMHQINFLSGGRSQEYHTSTFTVKSVKGEIFLTMPWQNAVSNKKVFFWNLHHVQEEKSMDCGMCVYTAKLEKSRGDHIEDKLLWPSWRN